MKAVISSATSGTVWWIGLDAEGVRDLDNDLAGVGDFAGDFASDEEDLAASPISIIVFRNIRRFRERVQLLKSDPRTRSSPEPGLGEQRAIDSSAV